MKKSILAAACAIVVGAGVFSITLLHAANTPATQPAKAPATQPAKAPDPKPVNTKCPVTGEDIDPKVTTVYDGKTFAFCCEDCVKAFKKNPEKYAGSAK